MAFAIDLFTLYPEMFPGPLGVSLAGTALEENMWSLKVHSIRDHGLGRHKSVDDTPFGGGPGMVLRADVLAHCLDSVLVPNDPRPRFLLSPRGRPLTQARVRALSRGPGLIVVCGRFEGVDERIIETRGLEELSIGDYILSGGEIAAMVVLDSCIRLLPHVMGDMASAYEESFENGLLEYPHYTRPRIFEGHLVPDVLLSGDHAKIAAFRRAQALHITQQRRPDLCKKREDLENWG